MWTASFQGKLLLFKEYNNVKGVTGTSLFWKRKRHLVKSNPKHFQRDSAYYRDRQKKKGRPFAGYFVHTCRYSIGFWQVPAPVCNVKHVLPQNTRCSPRSARPTALSCAFSGMVLGLDVLRGQYRSKWTKKIPQIPLQSKFRTSLHAEASRRECRNWKFSCRKCVRLSSARNVVFLQVSLTLAKNDFICLAQFRMR
jgi:hypothetical protein